jgi:putative membrane protein
MIRNYTDHAANERTFLAWVRTAVAIVGFGLAVARFGNTVTPVWSEVGLLVSGTALVLVAYVRMLVVRHRIDRQEELDDASTGPDMLLVLLIAALFVMIAMFVANIG